LLDEASSEQRWQRIVGQFLVPESIDDDDPTTTEEMTHDEIDSRHRIPPRSASL
jgi:hypothetical protein